MLSTESAVIESVILVLVEFCTVICGVFCDGIFTLEGLGRKATKNKMKRVGLIIHRC
jgi:hypothetical protein